MAEANRHRPEPPIPSLDGSVHAVAPDVAVDFLKNIMPFKELDDVTIRELALHCKIDFYPKGTRLYTYNETEVVYLHLIQRGGIRAFITDEDGQVVLKDYRGVGANVGALGIIRGTKANLNIETVEDTFCFLIHRDVFLDLVRNNSVVAHYFLKSFSDNVVATAYSELRRNKLTRRSADELFLFSAHAGDLGKPVFSVSASTSIQEAARTMSEQAIGSILIYADEDPGSMIGIITDRDLRGKVIAEGKDFRQPVASIMSSPLKTVPAKMLCFDVLLKMMTTGIHHLGVEQGGRVIGVITSHDIMVQQGNSPYYLFKEIAGQQDFEGVYLLAEKVSSIVRNIINEGAKAGNIARMVALINEKILSRILLLLHKQLGPPPVKYCWLLLGSEGRGEQTFKVDQENGIVYADPVNAEEQREAEQFFAEFGSRAVEHLIRCGYPPGRKGIMAGNPDWCMPLGEWKRRFSRWIHEADAREQLEASLFFDFSYGFGTEQLAVDLRDYVITETTGASGIAESLGHYCITNKAPLSFFKNFVVEQSGEHKDRFDISSRGLLPFIDFARVLSLYFGVRETNTLGRLKSLLSWKKISKDLYDGMVDAFELQMQLWVIHQLSQIENGMTPDDYIYPDQLTDLERRMLKDGFRVIERMQQMLAQLLAESRRENNTQQ